MDGNRDNSTGLAAKPLRRPDRFFFGTRALPCPYLPGRVERKAVTDLSGPDSEALYERLSRAGFRRSHSLAYRPACEGCNECVPVRIRTSDFAFSKSFRRTLRVNRDLTAEDLPAHASMEQYRLFAAYQRTRHAGGDMSAMLFDDYQSMIEETPVDSRIIEYRDGDGALIAAMLADRMSDSYSAVYSFFSPDMPERGLGTFMVLWLVEQARATGRDYVYLGFWVAESDKMAYKARFQPLEGLGPDGWAPIGA